MTGIDPVSGLNSVLTLWKRGSLLLWALGCASLGTALALLVYTLLTGDQSARAWILYAAIAAIVFLILATFKTYQEKTIKTMAFSPAEAQSFIHQAPQADGRKLTQIALRGKISNISTQPIYPTDVRLLSPRGMQLVDRHILTEHEGGKVYGFDNAVPPGKRSGFSVHFFVDGLLGTPGTPLTIVISISDQLGHWHRVAFNRLPNQ